MNEDDIEVEQEDDGRIIVTITETIGDTQRTITAWAEVRDDLGLNENSEPIDGVELLDETPYYYDDDPEEDEWPDGWTEAVLAFDDVEALQSARRHLEKQARKRFEWGVSEAGDVRDFAGKLPTEYDISEAEA